MQISIGIDLGERRTGIWALSEDRNEQTQRNVLVRPRNQSLETYAAIIVRTIEQLRTEADRRVVVAIDVPLFPTGCDCSGREIEAAFQWGRFSNASGKAAIQPNNPQGIARTVELGRTLLALLAKVGMNWSPNADLANGTGIIEVMPTLALGLLAPADRLIEERPKFSLYGDAFALMRVMHAYREGPSSQGETFLDRSLITDSELLTKNLGKDDVAALVAARLGQLLQAGTATIAHCARGHYVLPPRKWWHSQWAAEMVELEKAAVKWIHLGA